MGRFEELARVLERPMAGVPAPQRSMTMDMLRTYCWYADKVDEVQAQIDAEGPLIDGIHGPKANPLCSVLQQYSGQKANYYQKCMKELGRIGSDAADALSEFVRM